MKTNTCKYKSIRMLSIKSLTTNTLPAAIWKRTVLTRKVWKWSFGKEEYKRTRFWKGGIWDRTIFKKGNSEKEQSEHWQFRKGPIWKNAISKTTHMNKDSSKKGESEKGQFRKGQIGKKTILKRKHLNYSGRRTPHVHRFLLVIEWIDNATRTNTSNAIFAAYHQSVWERHCVANAETLEVHVYSSHRQSERRLLTNEGRFGTFRGDPLAVLKYQSE